MSLVCDIALMLGTTLAGHCGMAEATEAPVREFPPIIIREAAPVPPDPPPPVPAPAWNLPAPPPPPVFPPPPPLLRDEWPVMLLPTPPKGWVWRLEAHLVPKEAE
ncbi:hypothetical protein GCM10027256_32660 [Novispirillum itersonii subsp. nipponicum]